MSFNDSIAAVSQIDSPTLLTHHMQQAQEREERSSRNSRLSSTSLLEHTLGGSKFGLNTRTLASFPLKGSIATVSRRVTMTIFTIDD